MHSLTPLVKSAMAPQPAGLYGTRLLPAIQNIARVVAYEDDELARDGSGARSWAAGTA